MRGRLLLVTRLLLRDLRKRRTETALLLVCIAAATATLTLGRTLQDIVDRPYQQTRAATDGPDLSLEPGYNGPEALAALENLMTDEGITAHSEPIPLAFSTLTAHDLTLRVVIEGRQAAPSAVDRPVVTDGTWVRPGGVVVERSFADALGIHEGDTVTVGGQRRTVTGIAVTASRPMYPSAGWHQPYDVAREHSGLIWADRGDLEALAGGKPLSYVLLVKLADPDGAEAFYHQPHIHPLLRGWQVMPWQDIAASNDRRYENARVTLQVAGWLLTVLAIAGVAGVVAGRIAARRRRVGLLKAVGAGPALVAAANLAEYLLIGLVAAGVGLSAGWFGAPVLFRPSAGLLGSPGVQPPLGTVVAAIVLAVAIAAVATLMPVVRAAATSTVSALEDAPPPPRRRGWRVRLSRRLPTALLIGTRINARRPRRARLVTVNTFVVAAAFAAVLQEVGQDHSSGIVYDEPLPDASDRLTIQAMLITVSIACVLALLNTVVNTWSTVTDARQPLAVARALGATPGQAGAGLAVAQLLPALPGVVFGIPFGILLYRIFARGDVAPVPGWWMVAIGLGVLTAVAALTAVPALAVARRPVADGLAT